MRSEAGTGRRPARPNGTVASPSIGSGMAPDRTGSGGGSGSASAAAGGGGPGGDHVSYCCICICYSRKLYVDFHPSAFRHSTGRTGPGQQCGPGRRLRANVLKRPYNPSHPKTIKQPHPLSCWFVIHIGVELRHQGILTEEIPIREPQGFNPNIYIVTDSYLLQQE